jgi:hypothetical protein
MFGFADEFEANSAAPVIPVQITVAAPDSAAVLDCRKVLLVVLGIREPPARHAVI